MERRINRSSLADRLLEKHSFGYISAVRLLTIAECGVKGCTNQSAQSRITFFGPHGKHEGNKAAELKRLLFKYTQPVEFIEGHRHDIPQQVLKGPEPGRI